VAALLSLPAFDDGVGSFSLVHDVTSNEPNNKTWIKFLKVPFFIYLVFYGK
jgi:hypothetical protein